MKLKIALLEVCQILIGLVFRAHMTARSLIGSISVCDSQIELLNNYESQTVKSWTKNGEDHNSFCNVNKMMKHSRREKGSVNSVNGDVYCVRSASVCMFILRTRVLATAWETRDVMRKFDKWIPKTMSMTFVFSHHTAKAEEEIYSVFTCYWIEQSDLWGAPRRCTQSVHPALGAICGSASLASRPFFGCILGESKRRCS